MNTTITIFKEAILSSLALPLGDNITLFAMHYFGDSEVQNYIIIAILGGFIGCMFSYSIGRLFHLFMSRLPQALKVEHYEMARRNMTRYGVWLAAFYWAGPLSMLPLALGFLRVPLWRVALAVVVGTVLEYRVILGF
jgi:membrane protein YqaA with SNARE-associated domain